MDHFEIPLTYKSRHILLRKFGISVDHKWDNNSSNIIIKYIILEIGLIKMFAKIISKYILVNKNVCLDQVSLGLLGDICNPLSGIHQELNKRKNNYWFSFKNRKEIGLINWKSGLTTFSKYDLHMRLEHI